MTKTRTDRVVTSEELMAYRPMVEFWLKQGIVKNWKEASLSRKQDNVMLGNSGYTMADVRQHLLTEVLIALKNYDPEKKTKESSFVYTHLKNRVGGMMKKHTKKKSGYGSWTANLEHTLHEIDLE